MPNILVVRSLRKLTFATRKLTFATRNINELEVIPDVGSDRIQTGYLDKL